MRAFVVVLSACVFAGLPARADDEAPARTWLFFSGTDVSSLSAFSWASFEIPFGGHSSGVLLRATAGAGGYSYDLASAPGGEVGGTVMLADILAGWRHIRGDVCLTFLAGLAVEDHDLDAPDPENTVEGTQTGVKLAAELFWRPTDRFHVEASATYASTFDFWRVRLAGGHDFGRFAVGPEFEAFGNERSHQIRAGLAVTSIRWRRFGFNASFGALNDGDRGGAYGRLSMERGF